MEHRKKVQKKQQKEREAKDRERNKKVNGLTQLVREGESVLKKRNQNEFNETNINNDNIDMRQVSAKKSKLNDGSKIERGNSGVSLSSIESLGKCKDLTKSPSVVSSDYTDDDTFSMIPKNDNQIQSNHKSFVCVCVVLRFALYKMFCV